MNGKRHSLKLWAVLIWLLVWQLASMAVGKEILLVSPVRTVIRFGELAREAAFWRTAAYTLTRILLGFALAAAAGILTAVLAARFPAVRDLMAPLILTVKSVPVASFIIVALIWVSSKRLSVLIAFLMGFPVLYTNLLDGILAVDPKLSEMAAVYRLTLHRRLLHVILPQVMPFLRAGCALALGFCWKSGIAAEVIGTPVGSVGEKLQRAKVYLETPDLFAWTLAIILLSMGCEKIVMSLLRLLERRLTRC